MLGCRRTRRLALLLLVLSVAGVLWQRRALGAAGVPEPSWPPFEPTPTPTPTQGFGASTPEFEPEEAPQPAESEPAANWVPAVDGACPTGYPVKANDNSRIFHVPGGRFYDRTIPERCYATADDALADGYRRAKA